MDTLKFRNQSSSIPRLAIFKKSYATPSLGLSAWEIVAPPRLGSCVVEVPVTYDVYISANGDNPNGGCRSKSIVLPSFSGELLVIPRATSDNAGYVPDLVQIANKDATNEVHITNSFGRAVWGHILNGGTEVYPAQLIVPGDVLMADLRTSFWVAHISELVRKGTRLVEAEISVTATEMLPGQTLTITGSRLTGFELTVS